ncbi:hypothetical protein [Saccharopolyspora shandongensis]|uniref:hypothetical protein n=1 Tax=Saccharopolyspora shandongensis TaxID=418495 RepID=UPI0033FC91B3
MRQEHNLPPGPGVDLPVELHGERPVEHERGKADGTLDAEVTVTDLYMIVGALATVSRAAIGDWRRFVDIALAGLRPRD